MIHFNLLYFCPIRYAATTEGELEKLSDDIDKLKKQEQELKADLGQAKHRVRRENKSSCSSSNGAALDRLQDQLNQVAEKLKHLREEKKLKERPGQPKPQKNALPR